MFSQLDNKGINRYTVNKYFDLSLNSALFSLCLPCLVHLWWEGVLVRIIFTLQPDLRWRAVCKCLTVMFAGGNLLFWSSCMPSTSSSWSECRSNCSSSVNWLYGKYWMACRVLGLMERLIGTSAGRRKVLGTWRTGWQEVRIWRTTSRTTQRRFCWRKVPESICRSFSVYNLRLLRIPELLSFHVNINLCSG